MLEPRTVHEMAEAASPETDDSMRWVEIAVAVIAAVAAGILAFIR